MEQVFLKDYKSPNSHQTIPIIFDSSTTITGELHESDGLSDIYIGKPDSTFTLGGNEQNLRIFGYFSFSGVNNYCFRTHWNTRKVYRNIRNLIFKFEFNIDGFHIWSTDGSVDCTINDENSKKLFKKFIGNCVIYIYKNTSIKRLNIIRKQNTGIGRRKMMGVHPDIVKFEDPEVKRICVENFGGANGITNLAFGTVGIKGYEGEVTYRQAENVKNLAQLFKNNSLIRRFNELKYFNNVVSLYHTFNGCKNLEEISLPRFTKVDINCAVTFANCVSLTKINELSNIKKITTIESMFYKCESLEHIDLTGIDLSNCKLLDNVFNRCTNLKSINFGNFNFTNIISYKYLFAYTKLEELINFDYETFGINSTSAISRYQASAGIFHTCTKLITEDFVRYKLRNFNGFSGDTFVSTNCKYYDFRNCTNLKGISFASFSHCMNNEGFTLPDVPNFIIDGCFYDYGNDNAKFPYNRKYIRFLSETPPNIKNNYSNNIPINWYVPSNSIQAYRDYITSINSYFTIADNIIIKPLEAWYDDCDKFGWTKYEEGGTVYNLPAEFEALEYIENTTNAYIDTGIIPNQLTEIKMDARLITRNEILANGNFPFGARENYAINDFSYMWIVNNQISSYWSFGNQSQIINKGFDYGKHELTIINMEAFFDRKLEKQFKSLDFTSPVSLYLFSCNSQVNPTNDYSFKGRIYNTRIWQNQTLVRYFVPVRQKATGKLGMYDFIEGNFYTSPNNIDFIGA